MIIKTNYGRGHVINNDTDALAPTTTITQIEYNVIICILEVYKVHTKLNVFCPLLRIELHESLGLDVTVSPSSQ